MPAFDARQVSTDVTDGSYWKPAGNLGVVHAAVCTGESRSLTTEYGTSTASVVETMMVWGEDLDSPPERLYSDVFVLPSFLAAQCRDRGLVVGRLTQPDRRYELAPLSKADWAKIRAWLSENVDASSGEVTWRPDSGGGASRDFAVDDAPF